MRALVCVLLVLALVAVPLAGALPVHAQESVEKGGLDATAAAESEAVQQRAPDIGRIIGERIKIIGERIKGVGKKITEKVGSKVTRRQPIKRGPSTWNQFQAATRGQFSSRDEARKAWSAYKDANGIVTGSVRSQAAKSQYLKGLAEGGKSPKWMNQWLQEGKVPPGYEVDHIKPLSIGGEDTPSNMRLLDKATHDTHHKFYRPWQ